MGETVLTSEAICPTLPFKTEGASLQLMEDGAFSIVAPFRGQEAGVSLRLVDNLGMGLPDVGGSNAQVQWFAAGQWAVLADAAMLAKTLDGLAAVTDQSDGWCGLKLTGSDAASVMARLCPLDLREEAMPPGCAARTELCHLMAHILRRSDGFGVRVMRSFAEGAVSHISDAMISVAAQRDKFIAR